MAYTIKEADLVKDKEVLLQFCKANRKRFLDDKYAWIYEANPDGNAIVWMLIHNETDECVGMSALFPRKISIDGQPYNAAVAGDLLVNTKHRTIGPALMLQKAVISAVDNDRLDLIYAFPNEKAQLISKRVGYRLLGQTIRLVKIIKSRQYLTNRGMSEIISGPASTIIDAFLYLTSRETWDRRKGGIICETVDTLDQRFEGLWDTYRRTFLVAAERSYKYMNWKYGKDPDDVNLLYVAYSKDKRIMYGCIVYTHNQDIIQIRDLILSNKNQINRYFIYSFLRHIRPLAVRGVIVTLLENEKLMKKLLSYGFIKGDYNLHAYIHVAQHLKDKQNILYEQNDWLLMKSDEDT